MESLVEAEHALGSGLRCFVFAFPSVFVLVLKQGGATDGGTDLVEEAQEGRVVGRQELHGLGHRGHAAGGAADLRQDGREGLVPGRIAGA